MLSNLPTYKISIDDEYSNGEELGIQQIAFTANPAIKVKGIAFSNQEPIKQFFADSTKMRIAAPAIIPMSIYRADDNEEYYVEFTAKEIDRIHQKFMKKIASNKNAVFNLEHDSNETVPAYILEAWLVENPEKDKSFSTYGIKVPKGTLFVVSQLTDKTYYDSLVANEQVGYSIEGFLGLSLSELINNKKQKEEKMNENNLNLPDGEWTLGEKIYVIKDGAVAEIKDVVAEEMADATSGSTEVACAAYTETKLDSGTPARFEGELTVGTKLEVQKEDGSWVKADAGQHNLEDGRVVYVDADGLINEIQTPDTKKVDETQMAEVSGNTAVVDTTVVEPVAEEALPTYTREELDAKLEEIYRLIADLRAEEVIEDAGEEVTVEEVMTLEQKFAAVSKLVK